MSDAATDAAQRFVDGIVWGAHRDVWELLGENARSLALSVAIRNGLDRVTASRLDQELADPVDEERFLTELVAGLRRDLRSVDVDQLGIVGQTEQPDGSVVVELGSASAIPGTSHWDAGRLVMRERADGAWVVDRFEPRVIER